MNLASHQQNPAVVLQVLYNNVDVNNIYFDFFFAPFFLKLFPVDFCIASSMTSYTRKSPQSVASFRSRSSTPKRTQKNKREN